MRFKAPYVSFRNGHAHFMIRVPLDLVGKFKSQYIRKTLKTSHPSEAKLLASSMALKVKSSFTLLRSGADLGYRWVIFACRFTPSYRKCGNYPIKSLKQAKDIEQVKQY
jgi:hypothetical protein